MGKKCQNTTFLILLFNRKLNFALLWAKIWDRALTQIHCLPHILKTLNEYTSKKSIESWYFLNCEKKSEFVPKSATFVA